MPQPARLIGFVIAVLAAQLFAQPPASRGAQDDVGVQTIPENSAPRVKLAGHTDQVYAVAYAPDGKSVASGSGDKTVKIWDLRTEQTRITLEGHRNWVEAIAYSPDGSTLASGDRDGVVKLWNPATGKESASLAGHWGIRRLIFIYRGAGIVTASIKYRQVTVDRFDLVSWKIAKSTTIKPGERNVTDVAIAPDGSAIATACEDGYVYIWDAATGRLRDTLFGQTPFTAVAWSPDGKLIAAGDGTGWIRVWDATGGRLIASMIWAPGFRLFDPRSGKRELPTREAPAVDGLAFSADSKTLVNISGNTVAVWDPLTGDQLNASHDAGFGRSAAMALSPDGQTLANGGNHRFVSILDLYKVRARIARFYDAPTGPDFVDHDAREMLRRHWQQVNAVAWSADGKLVASGGRDHMIWLWNPAAGKPICKLEGHRLDVTDVDFSPDGRSLASIDNSGVVQVWDLARQRFRMTLGQPDQNIRPSLLAVAFSPDGKLLVGGTTDGEIRVWDAASGALRKRLKGPGSLVHSLSFSPDSRELAAGFLGPGGNQVRLIDIAAGRDIATLPHATTAAFSGDGKRLITLDGAEVKLWDADGKLVSRLGAHKYTGLWVAAVGNLLASSGGRDVKVWDANTGREVTQFDGATQSDAQGIAFAPDGKMIAAARTEDVAIYELSADHPHSSAAPHLLNVQPQPPRPMQELPIEQKPGNAMK